MNRKKALNAAIWVNELACAIVHKISGQDSDWDDHWDDYWGFVVEDLEIVYEMLADIGVEVGISRDAFRALLEGQVAAEVP